MTDTEAAPEQEPTEEETPPRRLSLLAQQNFGNEFHGTVQEEPETEPPEDEAEQPEPEAEESEEQPEPEITEEGTEDEEELVSSFSDLVESQEWDWDWFKTLSTPVSVSACVLASATRLLASCSVR